MRQLCSVRGRVRHYTVCIRHLLPFVPIFSAVLGTDKKIDYDGIVQLPSIITTTADHLISIVNQYALAGQPLHPYVPSSLYYSLLSNQVGSARIVAITVDASLHGWGALIRWWNNIYGVIIVGHLPDTDDMQHQVRREAEAIYLAFTASSRLVDLHSATCILRNDARGALASLRKGNFRSTHLQSCAMRLSKSAATLNCDLLFLHAPGRDLVEEGIDRLSRDVALSLRGPSCNADLRLKIYNMAATLGWVLSIDLFATSSNALTARFFSRFPEPQSEFEDAFGVDNWNQSLCPHCLQLHREVIFAFPPLPLINRFLHKSRVDKIRGIVIVPVAVTSEYWNRLLHSSINNSPDGYYRLRHAHSHLDWAADFTPPELAIFCIDLDRILISASWLPGVLLKNFFVVALSLVQFVTNLTELVFTTYCGTVCTLFLKCHPLQNLSASSSYVMLSFLLQIQQHILSGLNLFFQPCLMLNNCLVHFLNILVYLADFFSEISLLRQLLNILMEIGTVSSSR